MRRFLLAAGGDNPPVITPTDPVDPVDPDPIVDPLDADPGTLPYAHRTFAPWNAPTYAVTPTPDGSGSAVHPDVIDFGPSQQWNGWRFWMGVTPYHLSEGAKENPTILVSSDGFTWQTPTGADPDYLFLPINGGINSDTDLVHDPDLDRLILTWREFIDGDASSEWIYASTSTDGTTWTTPVLLWSVMSTTANQNISQALVRVGPGDWRAWVRNQPAGTNGGIALRTATDPLGPWSAPTQCTMSPAVPPEAERFWHLDVIRHGGRFLALLSYFENKSAVSVDGVNWTVVSPAILSDRPGQWDQGMYRGTLQPHVDGEHMRVWYSSNGPDSWRVGYTMVPLSLWD